MSGRVFTVDEANALLPALEEAFRKLDPLVERTRQAQRKLQVLELLWDGREARPDNPDHREYLELRRGAAEADRAMGRILRHEILRLGVRFPAGGLEFGLVDFPTRFRGRWIYLCWKRGEPELKYWHEVDGGFRGRRRITPLQATVMGREG